MGAKAEFLKKLFRRPPTPPPRPKPAIDNAGLPVPRQGQLSFGAKGDVQLPANAPAAKKLYTKLMHGTPDPDWKAGKFGSKGLLDYVEGYKGVSPWIPPTAAVFAVAYKKQWDQEKKREAEKKETERSRTAWRIQQDAEARKKRLAAEKGGKSSQP